MNRNQFFRKHALLNVPLNEVERRWRIHLFEEEQVNMMQRLALSTVTSSVGAGGISPEIPDVMPVPDPDTDSHVAVLNAFYAGGSSTWQYFVMDWGNGVISEFTNTGLMYDDGWAAQSNFPVDGHGFMLLMRNGDDYAAYFVGRTGELIDVINITSNSLDAEDLDGRWVVLVDYEHGDLIYFNGTSVTRINSVFDGSMNFYFGFNDGEETNEHGFVFTLTTDEGATYNYADINGITEVYSYSNSNEFGISVSFNSYSDFIYVTRYNSNDSSQIGFDIIRTDGTVLHSVTYAETYQNNSNYSPGSNKLLVIAYNDEEYLIHYYDGSRNLLLSKTHDRINYPSYNVSQSQLDPTDRDSSKTENVLITLYNTDNANTHNLHQVSYCNLIPIWDGANAIDDVLILQDSGSYDKSVSVYSVYFTTSNMYILMSPDNVHFNLVCINSSGYEIIDVANPITEDPIVVSDMFISWGSEVFGDRFLLKVPVKTVTEDLKYNELYYLYGHNAMLLDVLKLETFEPPQESKPDMLFIKDTNKTWYTNSGVDEFVEIPNFQGYDIVDQDPYSTPDMLESNNILNISQSASIYYFNDAGTDGINDGGGDMFDDGNVLKTNLGTVPYTHTQMNGISGEASIGDFMMNGHVEVGDLLFGTGSSYFTNLYPGLFVMVADNIDVSYFAIDGSTGADGNGIMDDYKYSLTHNETAYTVFVKKIFNAGDPSINHIIIANSDDPNIVHVTSSNTDDDDDSINNIENVTKVYYMLTALAEGFEMPTIAVETMVIKFLDLTYNKDINGTLSTLNTSYAQITNILQPDSYINGRVITKDTLSPTFSFPTSDGNFTFILGFTYLVYIYYVDQNVIIRMYDFNGNVLYDINTGNNMYHTNYSIADSFFVRTSNSDDVFTDWLISSATYKSKTYVRSSDITTVNDFISWDD